MDSRKLQFVLVVCTCLALLMSLFGVTSTHAAAALNSANVALVEVGVGLTQPLAIASAADGSGRLFIVERAGRIRILKSGSLLATPFLDIHTLVNSGSGEQGLLALAFHPNYASNGRFYTVYTNQDGSLVLSRFTRSQNDPDLADPNSRITLLTIPHPTNTNHNGGTLVFGPDGYLYWSTGDGGGVGDIPNNAQNLYVLLGKILRLDVDSGSPYSIPSSNPFFNSADPNIRKEIWAYGLRNPWRMAFDRQTGDLYIGDVGQSNREEIDFQPASSNGGENYGWHVMEGSLCYNPVTNCNTTGKVLPVAEYDHSLGCSVTGGYVYRGTAHPALVGYYLYADFCSGRLFSLKNVPGSGWQSAQLLDTPYSISTFGEDEQGQIFLADYSGGKIYKLLYSTFADVPFDYWAWDAIERLYTSRITGGCLTSPLMYCPGNTVNRDQMAVFLLRGIHGSSYVPPDVNGDSGFADVSPTSPSAPWIKQLAAEGITGGCGNGNYCPTAPVSRAAMAIFLLRAEHGSSYVPPDVGGSTGFDDVPPTYPNAAWIKQLVAEGITSGCDNNNFCPTSPVTRDQMAVFLVRTLNLP